MPKVCQTKIHGKAFEDAYRTGYFEDLTIGPDPERGQDEELWLAHTLTNELPIIGIVKGPVGVAVFVSAWHLQDVQAVQIEALMKSLGDRVGLPVQNVASGCFAVGALPRRLARKEAHALAVQLMAKRG